jgi:hypothetical protein
MAARLNALCCIVSCIALAAAVDRSLVVTPRTLERGLTAGGSLALHIGGCSGGGSNCNVYLRIVGPLPSLRAQQLRMRRSDWTARATLRAAGTYRLEARCDVTGHHIRASPARIVVHAGATHPHGSSITVPSKVVAGAEVEVVVFAADYDGNPTRSAYSRRRNRFEFEVRWLPPLPRRALLSPLDAAAPYAPWPPPPPLAHAGDGGTDPAWATSQIVAQGTAHAWTSRSVARTASFAAPTRVGRVQVRVWLAPCARLANRTLGGSATTRRVVAARVCANKSTASRLGTALGAVPEAVSDARRGALRVVVGTRVVERLQLRDAFGNACPFGAPASVVGSCAQKPRKEGRGALKVSAALVRTPKDGGGVVATAAVRALPSGEIEITAVPLRLGRLRWDVRVGSVQSSAGLGLFAPLRVVAGDAAPGSSDARVCAHAALALPPLPAVAWRFPNRAEANASVCCVGSTLGATRHMATAARSTPIAVAQIREPAVLTLRLRLRDAFRNALVTTSSTNGDGEVPLSTVEALLAVVVDGEPLPPCSAASLGRTLANELRLGCAALSVSPRGAVLVAARLPSRTSVPAASNGDEAAMEQGLTARGATSAAWWCDGAARRVQLLYDGVALKIHPRVDASSDCSDAEELGSESLEGAAAAGMHEDDEDGEGEDEDDAEYDDDEGEGERARCRGYAPDEIAVLTKPRWPGCVGEGCW